MSEQQQNGQRRNQGGNRNRSNNNRNSNNNNRNRNNNRNKNNRNYKKPEPKPLVLTGWQKFLKIFGLFNEEKARKKQQINTRTPQRKFENKSGSKPNGNKPNNTRGTKSRRAPEKIPVETPRLYVGNLSYDASDSDIEELFKGIGNVKNVEIIYNRHTHRSKGYGFVQMFNTEDAKRAVEVLHDQPFLGRNMIVNGSKARKPSDPTAQANTEEADTADSSAA